jgi:hypothetical protein
VQPLRSTLQFCGVGHTNAQAIEILTCLFTDRSWPKDHQVAATPWVDIYNNPLNYYDTTRFTLPVHLQSPECMSSADVLVLGEYLATAISSEADDSFTFCSKVEILQRHRDHGGGEDEYLESDVEPVLAVQNDDEQDSGQRDDAASSKHRQDRVESVQSEEHSSSQRDDTASSQHRQDRVVSVQSDDEQGSSQRDDAVSSQNDGKQGNGQRDDAASSQHRQDPVVSVQSDDEQGSGQRDDAASSQRRHDRGSMQDRVEPTDQSDNEHFDDSDSVPTDQGSPGPVGKKRASVLKSATSRTMRPANLAGRTKCKGVDTTTQVYFSCASAWN